jgi:hypothetical protein
MDSPGEIPCHSILKRYVEASSQDEASGLLERLIVDVANPIVRSVVRRRFFSAHGTSLQDREDVGGDAIAAIIGRLHGLRGMPQGDSVRAQPLRDFEAYSAGVASRSATRFFMARSPQRTLLRNRLRYVLATDQRFRIWQSDQGAWHCAMSGRGVVPVLTDDEVERCHAKLAGPAQPSRRLPELIMQIFKVARGALELSALTSMAADSLGIMDRGATMDEVDTLRSKEAGADEQAQMRDSMRELWLEVCKLPVPQRRALLLNLGAGGAAGRGVGMWLIPDLGIASFSVLADKLEMTREQLAEIWNDLPLPDNETGRMFGLQRQQIINLRSAARERLMRRLPI